MTHESLRKISGCSKGESGLFRRGSVRLRTTALLAETVLLNAARLSAGSLLTAYRVSG